jgi:CheY-like chemotaxis protein
MRLLVVDEDEDIRSVIEELVIDYDYVVWHAATVEDAISGLLREIDVALFHLPVLRIVSERSSVLPRVRGTLRIVSMSASEAPAPSDPVDAHLRKPFSRAQLLAALSERTTTKRS